MNQNKKIIIFTDLDGTLLDANTYSSSEAAGAIQALIKRKIPIIPCTSKTHLEVIETRNQLNLTDPFIVENGSALFFTPGYFNNSELKINSLDNYQYHLLGSGYEEILAFFNDWRSRYKIDIVGFHEMPVEQVQKLTGLSYAEAGLARKRFFSEPFILNKNAKLPREAVDNIYENGFRLLRGNRFYHLLGNSDKGAAVKKLTSMFMKKWNTKDIFTVGLGDSMNDLEMLQSVQSPFLVKKPTGNHQAGIEINNLMLTKGIGPAGWQEAIFEILNVSPL